MKAGAMKQVVSAVHALKCREGVSRVELDLFLQQKFGARGPRECEEALERALTEGFVQLKNNRYYPKASGLPAELSLPVPVRMRTLKKASTSIRTSRNPIGKGRKKKGGGRKRGRGGGREAARVEVQEVRRQRNSKTRRKRRKGRRHNNEEIEELEIQERIQNEGGQKGSNKEVEVED